MKQRLLFILLCLSLMIGLQIKAQTYNVHVETSGTLSCLIKPSDMMIVKELTLSGYLNGTDIIAIKDMPNLEILNISNSNIVPGGHCYYDTYATSENEIGAYFFSNKSKLKTVILPNNVTSIGDNAFGNCPSLTSLNIPNSVISIGHGAFSGCVSLTSFVIPNSVTSIGDYIFASCTGLASVTIPNTITSIGDGTFGGCSGLTSIIMPSTITSIGDEAFSCCSSLKGEMIIPDLVTSIGEYAFVDCRNLTSLTIPSSVILIGKYAFENCVSLTAIDNKNPIPLTIEANTFVNVNKTKCTLYVPTGCVSAYKNAAVWQEFKNIQEKDFSSINNTVDADNDIYVIITNGGLKIKGCDSQDKISVYTINGQLIHSSQAGDGFIEYPFEKDKIYIIYTPNKTLKITH